MKTDKTTRAYLRDPDFNDDYELTKVRPHPVAIELGPLDQQTIDDIRDGLAETKCCPNPIILENVTWLILDGVHRLKICLELGIEPPVKIYMGTPADAAAYAYKMNAHRRQMSEEIRVLLAAKYANAPIGKTPVNVPNGTFTTNAEAAAKFDTTERKVDRAKPIVANGSKVLQEAYVDKVIALSDAAAVASEPKAVQNKAVQMVAAGEAPTARAAVEQIAASNGNGKAHTNGKARGLRKKKEEPAEEADKVDANGYPIPTRALPAFAAAKRLNKICTAIDGIVAQVKAEAAGPGGRMMHAVSQMQTLQSVRRSIHGSRPTHVCPYCQGKEKECEPCKNGGWVDKTTFNQAPEAKQLAMIRKADAQ